MSVGERTEQATPRRREELRQKGQVARSMEISAAAGLIASLLALRFTAGGVLEGFQQLVNYSFSHATKGDLTGAALQATALTATLAFFKMVGPVVCAAALGGLIGGVSQVGFMVSLYPLQPQFNKLNPLTGLARLFSIQAVAGFSKALLKALIVGVTIYTFLKANLAQVVGLSGLDLISIASIMGGLMWGLLIRTAAALAIIAALDYTFQKFQFEKTNRMSKQDVKEEYKRTEGDPMIKARRRQRHREMARQRMMQDVPQATVVITNPTHIAVALRYEPEKSPAPTVIAKGERLIAQKIKEIARQHRIPVIENKPLARALNKATKVGDQIPPDLYQAVAEVLAFVYKMSGQSAFSRN